MNGANRARGSNASAMDMTCGSIRRRLLAFTLPIMMGNLFQQLYSMADTAVVGRGVGAQALAAYRPFSCADPDMLWGLYLD